MNWRMSLCDVCCIVKERETGFDLGGRCSNATCALGSLYALMQYVSYYFTLTFMHLVDALSKATFNVNLLCKCIFTENLTTILV